MMTANASSVAAPDASEYAPYYSQYISLVRGNDILRTLEEQGSETVALLSGLTEQQADHRHAPGKWSIKEAVGHVTDTERIFAYRAPFASRAMIPNPWKASSRMIMCGREDSETGRWGNDRGIRSRSPGEPSAAPQPRR
jgi:hypothetical protein